MSAARPSFEVLQEAAQWFAELGASPADAEQHRRWRLWHEADPTHQLAWRQVEAISGKFNTVPGGDKPLAHRMLDAAARARTRRRHTLKTLAWLCGAGLGASSLALPWGRWTAKHHTGLAERRDLRMADGAQIWLNTDSAIDVDYTPTLRRIRLLAGEILIATAADTQAPPRPFVVDTAQARLRALGTRYSVYQQDGSTVLAVFDGAVQIEPRLGGPPMGIVQAGQQTRIGPQGPGPIEAADMSRRAWAEGLIVAHNLRLQDFVAELSRYRHGYLGCDPAIADLRLVGTYAIADTDQVLETLQATLPLRVRKPLPWWTVLEPR
ncbi:FecR domain-containing protein [Bordetella genomosp. 12]|uniref:FecR domain-containing protein n=1 Tax=Bordetella genomosp. 12 TaxID=463035 RepID=UPI001FC9F886|nr:FecR domain-containing protein [Bordetella genomosp. 12]